MRTNRSQQQQVATHSATGWAIWLTPTRTGWTAEVVMDDHTRRSVEGEYRSVSAALLAGQRDCERLRNGGIDGHVA